MKNEGIKPEPAEPSTVREARLPPMQLWILLPSLKVRNWPQYDAVRGMVVRAYTEERARHIASLNASDEGSGAWLDPKKTSCEPLKAEGDEEFIISDVAGG